MTKRLWLSVAVLTALGAAIPATAAAQKTRQANRPGLDASVLHGLTWRNIGPYRGGRVTTVAGVPGQPRLYYLGATGGGIWKTENAGYSWKPIADGQIAMGSVGSLAVAPSDPNVIYAGMGEAPVRGVSSSWGDGVYRSTDAGKTWSHAGLTESRTISKVIVHPTDPDLVYVAAQGSRWGPNAERGVFRSSDGGKTWKAVLVSPDSLTGPSDLAMDPTNPRILYAAMWDAQRLPWYVRSGGAHGGIWKTTDGGDTWTRLTEGLPPLMGKIGIAVSRPDPSRVWAVVEADHGGLYRSDDAGAHWKLINGDRVLQARSWYYMRVTADPANADVVYVINAPVLKSIDAGKSFTPLPDRHGDNHFLWINPDDPANLIKADDGGAAISFDGGTTWSSIDNQPTGQFYRVNTDDRFPYWVYGGQQDNSSVAIPNAVVGPGITSRDWHDAGGCESAHVAFDPEHPRYLYAGCYNGAITEYDNELGTARDVMEYPFNGLGEPSDQTKYRWNWSAPIATSPHDRHVIYHGGNRLFRSSDRGHSWTAISPDLTRNDKRHQGAGGGPITNEGAGGEVYGTIYYLVESPHRAGVIWVGTDDGLVQLTRDGGRTWTNVTPKGLPESLINSIEVSPHDSATAYVAVSRWKWNDNAPLIYRTTDFGASWTTLVTGLPAGEPVRVVREDPNRPGLLYAGTETGAWVSFDDGGHWQSLQLDLPHVPVTDMQVRRKDLVISTEGRGFWILDDLSPVEELTEASAGAATFLFTPRAAYRTDLGANSATPGTGRNAPQGAVISYRLAAAPDSGTTLTLEFLDAQGRVVRTATSADPKPGRPPHAHLTPKAGLNRFVWDLRTEPAIKVPGIQTAEGGGSAGYRVAPGGYQVRLTVGSESQTRPLTVEVDPRTAPSPETVREQQRLLAAIMDRVNEIHRAAIQLRGVEDQLGTLQHRLEGRPQADTVAARAKPLVAAIDSVLGRMVDVKSKTFQDVVNFKNGLNDQLFTLMAAIDGTDQPVTQGMEDRWRDLEAEWQAMRPDVTGLLGPRLDDLNALVRSLNVPAVTAPPAP